jgi:membrane protein DedA with SNARE-associated domain
MDWWTTLGTAVDRFVAQYGLLAAFVLIAVEEAGVPSPLPADILVLLGAIQVRQGRLQLWQLLAVAELATVVGASGLYFLARWAGRDLVYRYGHYVHATPARLNQVEARLRHATVWTVAAGRIIPGLRVLTAAACGVFEVPYRVFLPGMALGGFVYIAVFAALGYLLGPPIVAVLDAVEVPVASLLSLGLVALVFFFLWRARAALLGPPLPLGGPGRFRAGMLAGLLAAVTAALVFNGMTGVVGAVADLFPGVLEHATLRRFAGEERRLVPLLLSLVGLVVLGAILGGVYGRWAEGGLRRITRGEAVRGLAFALGPWALTVGALPPLMELNPAETAGLAVVQAVRHAAFGAVLGLAYPLFRARLLAAVTPRSEVGGPVGSRLTGPRAPGPANES